MITASCKTYTSVDTPMPWKNEDGVLRKTLHDGEQGIVIEELYYPAGACDGWHTCRHGHGLYVLEGFLECGKGSLAPGDFLWVPAGTPSFHGAGAECDVRVLHVTNAPVDAGAVSPCGAPAVAPDGPRVLRTGRIPLKAEGRCSARLLLWPDDDNGGAGIMIKELDYARGQFTPLHIHENEAHGIYVLEGMLRCELGAFGQGAFLWHPASAKMEHGAVEGCSTRFLFISNKKLTTTFLD